MLTLGLLLVEMAGRGGILRGGSALLAILLVSLAAPLVALYDADSAVIQLTEADFDEKVMESSDALWLIEFYAPWCAPFLANMHPAALAGREIWRQEGREANHAEKCTRILTRKIHVRIL